MAGDQPKHQNNRGFLDGIRVAIASHFGSLLLQRMVSGRKIIDETPLGSSASASVGVVMAPPSVFGLLGLRQ